MWSLGGEEGYMKAINWDNVHFLEIVEYDDEDGHWFVVAANFGRTRLCIESFDTQENACAYLKKLYQKLKVQTLEDCGNEKRD